MKIICWKIVFKIFISFHFVWSNSAARIKFFSKSFNVNVQTRSRTCTKLPTWCRHTQML